jgi:hypothetical protein
MLNHAEESATQMTFEHLGLTAVSEFYLSSICELSLLAFSSVFL